MDPTIGQRGRAQTIAAIEQGQSWATVRLIADPPICRATFYNLRRRMRQNPVAARTDHRHGHAYKASTAVQDWLITYCTTHPHASRSTIHTALCHELGVQLTIRHLDRLRAQLGLSTPRPQKK